MNEHPPPSDHQHEVHTHAVDYFSAWLHSPLALQDRYLDAEPSDLWSRSTSWTGWTTGFSRRASQESDTTISTTAGLTCAAFSLCHATDETPRNRAITVEPQVNPKLREDEEAIDPCLEDESPVDEDELSEPMPKSDSDSDYMEKPSKRRPVRAARKAKKLPGNVAQKAKRPVVRISKRRRAAAGVSAKLSLASHIDAAEEAEHATYCHWPKCYKQTEKRNTRKIISDYFGRNNKSLHGDDVPWVQVCGARYDEELYNAPRRKLQLWALKRQMELWKHWDGFSHFLVKKDLNGHYGGKCTLQDINVMVQKLEQQGTTEETLRKFVAVPMRRI